MFDNSLARWHFFSKTVVVVPWRFGLPFICVGHVVVNYRIINNHSEAAAALSDERRAGELFQAELGNPLLLRNLRSGNLETYIAGES